MDPSGNANFHMQQQQQHMHMMANAAAGGGNVTPGMLMNNSATAMADDASSGNMPTEFPSFEMNGEMMDDPNGTVKLSKVLLVEVKGSPADFSRMGPTAGTWAPLTGRQCSMFAPDDVSAAYTMGDAAGGGPAGGGSMTGSDLSASTNALKNATITKATVLQATSTFPFPVGVTMSVLPNNEVCDTGDKYAFTALPRSTVNVPNVVYEAGESQAQAVQWRSKYSKFNAGNLETEDVLRVPGTQYVFVHQNHPAVGMLRTYKHILGIDVDTQPKMDGQWFKLHQPMLQSTCDAIRDQVLSRIATKDLTNLQVQLHRIGGADWGDISHTDAAATFSVNPTLDADANRALLAQHRQTLAKNPAMFMARIKLDYEIQKN